MSTRGAPKFLQRRAEADARPESAGFWYRLSRFVQRFPGRVAIAATVLMLTLGLPFWSIEFTSVDAQVLPQEKSARQVDDVLRADFPPFRDTPIDVVVDGANRDRGRSRRAPRSRARRGRRARPPPRRSTAATPCIQRSREPHVSEASRRR